MPGDNTPSQLTQQLRDRINQNKAPQITDTDSLTDKLLFMGNWHDAIPRALVFDPLLQSTDKCVYLLLRTYLTATGSTRMPSYDEIGNYLNLSRGTIARCLHILRAARWITLCNALRDESTGRFKSNTYAIHDEVLSIEEAMLLDGSYIEALEAMEQHHKHHRVKTVAYSVLENVRHGLQQDEPESPKSYGHIISRFLGGNMPSPIVSGSHVQNLDADKDPVQNIDLEAHPVQKLNSGYESQEKQLLNYRVQKIDSVVTKLDSVTNNSSSSYINNINIKTTTTTPSPEKTINQPRTSSQPINPELIWPSSLSGDARWVSWQAMLKCPPEHHQDLLDELAARLLPSSKKPIHNPAAWLAWASKELREEGIYPITNLGVNHRRLREREQQQKAKEPNRPRQHIKPTPKTEGLQHVAMLKGALVSRKSADERAEV